MVRQTARTFEPTNYTPTQARRFVEESLVAWGLSGITEPVVLAVSELATNAVTHGIGPVTLTLNASDDRVRVEVEDQGHGTPDMQRPDPEHGIPGGWGLHMVGLLADDWGVDSHRDTTAVWFERRLQAAQDDWSPPRP